jgi:hypothetical protein
MRPRCRTTSTSTLSIGLHIMSLLLGWAIAFTCGMHAVARWATVVILNIVWFLAIEDGSLTGLSLRRSPSYVIWGWMTMFVLWGGRSVALT